MSEMSEDDRIADLLVNDHTALTPSDAVVAIILVEGRYLLQGRDAISGIFYPGCWGFFGGAMEPGETMTQALARELHEELQLRVPETAFRYLTAHTFDFAYAGGETLHRTFFELSISGADFAGLTLGEGREMRLFTALEALHPHVPMTPYDAFALWQHVSAKRIVFKPKFNP